MKEKKLTNLHLKKKIINCTDDHKKKITFGKTCMKCRLFTIYKFSKKS